MWIRPSPHTRQTTEAEVRRATADPGTVAENPPMIESSRATWPPRPLTRSSAAEEDGTVSRTITGNVCDGWAAARAYSAGSALAGTPGEFETGGWTKSAQTNRTT